MLVVSVSAYDQLLCAQPPAVPSKLIQCPALGKHIIIVRLSVTYTALTCGDNTVTKCDWTNLDVNDPFYRSVASKCNNKKSCVVDSEELYDMKSAYPACGTGDWTERDTVRVYYDCTSDVVTSTAVTTKTSTTIPTAVTTETSTTIPTAVTTETSTTIPTAVTTETSTTIPTAATLSTSVTTDNSRTSKIATSSRKTTLQSSRTTATSRRGTTTTSNDKINSTTSMSGSSLAATKATKTVSEGLSAIEIIIIVICLLLVVLCAIVVIAILVRRHNHRKKMNIIVSDGMTSL